MLEAHAPFADLALEEGAGAGGGGECDVGAAEGADDAGLVAFAGFLDDAGDASFVVTLDEGVDDEGVKLGAAFADDFGDGDVGVESFSVGTVAGHGVEGVGHGDDASFEGDGVAGQCLGVSFAVVSFVMAQAIGNQGAQVFGVAQHAGAAFGVDAHFPRFFFAELSGFAQDGVVDGDLSDIVEDAADFAVVEVVFVPAEGARDLEGEVGDAPGVSDGVVVAHFDGVCGDDEVLAVGALELLGVLGVSDGDGGGCGECDEELQVALGEGIGGSAGVDVEDSEDVILVQKRRAHGGGDVLGEDALAGFEPGVIGGVKGDDSLALAEGAVDDGGADDGFAGVGRDVFCDKFSIDILKHNNTIMGSDEGEDLIHDAGEQLVEVAFAGDDLICLVNGGKALLDTALLFFGAGGLGSLEEGGVEVVGALGLDVVFGRIVEPYVRWDVLNSLEPQGDCAYAQEVAFFEQVFFDAALVYEGSVSAAQVLNDHALGSRAEQGMPPGYLQILKQDSTIGIAPNSDGVY